MNYESQLQEIFISSLQNQYGISEETVLYHYFVLRFFVSRMGKPVIKERKTKEMVQFIWDELNLPEGSDFHYQGEIIYRGIKMENSIENIMESWIFENSIRLVKNDKGIHLPMDTYIQQQQATIIRFANNKAKPYKNTTSHEWHWKHHAIERLNKVYDITPMAAKRIDGIHYPPGHPDYRRTLEEKGTAMVHASDYKRNDVKTISEYDVEQYLYSRLNLIEEGLTYVGRQIVIPDGRIDLLARDRNGVYVILELKVQEDKELVWQCMYYPVQIKKMYRVSEVRMMTIAPSYSESLLIPLRQLGYVEMREFLPTVELGRIEQLQIRSISNDIAA